MKSNGVIPHVEAVRGEERLVRRAKAGEADAFVQLYEIYGDNIYRYIYFRVMNDVAAEAITSHVFRHAWEHLDDYQKRVSSFARWIFAIAREQVLVYYKVNIKTQAIGIGCLAAAPDYSLDTDAQKWSNLEAWSGHLRLLTAEKEEGLHQTATLLIMRRSLDHLNPGRKSRPSPTFNAYTRQWLARYLQYHPRTAQKAPAIQWIESTYASLTRSLSFNIKLPEFKLPEFNIPDFGLPKLSPISWPASVAYTVLVGALLFTGTAQAQTALPGDALYGWKRLSEQAWVTLSPDPVAADMVLANRRLSEWIAVEHDPTRSAGAESEYIQALADFNSFGDTQSRARILPLIETHKRKLRETGLATAQLDKVLAAAANPTPVAADAGASPASVVALATATGTSTITAVDVGPTSTAAAAAIETATGTATPTQVLPTATAVPPTATATPTVVPPTATATPTVVPPTATPTEVPPTATATAVPTEVPPTATQVPTEVPPTPVPTDTPTEVIPPTDVPTQVIPPTDVPTQPPPTPTDVPTDTPVPNAALDASP